jgi:hypothetical protein
VLIRVVLPSPLRVLAATPREVVVDVEDPVSQRRLFDALEAAFPTLAGTIRDRATGRRRPFVRYFAGQEDLSHEPPDSLVPEAVRSGREPFIVLGAIAGG